jgi:hypothetical protein
MVELTTEQSEAYKKLGLAWTDLINPFQFAS